MPSNIHGMSNIHNWRVYDMNYVKYEISIATLYNSKYTEMR